VVEAIKAKGALLLPIAPRDFRSSPPESAIHQMRSFVRREGADPGYAPLHLRL
jgi:hypothetical protein